MLRRFCILGMVLGALMPLLARAQFIDIDVTHPQVAAISALAEEGVVQGYWHEGKKYFRPLQPVTRAEAVKMVLLSAAYPVPEGMARSFPDVAADAWFAPVVSDAVGRGIVKGYPDGSFQPFGVVTRAELLSMGLRAYARQVPAAEGEDWWQPIMQYAEQLRLVTGGADPNTALTRGQVAELLYRLQRVATHDFTRAYVYSGQGLASYYNPALTGNLTASGDRYDPEKLTAAHRTLPFGTQLLVSHGEKSVIVTVNDRGPYHDDRVLDLSQTAFSTLGELGSGVLDVQYEIYEPTPTTVPVPQAILEELQTEVAESLQIPDAIQAELDHAGVRLLVDESDDSSPSQSAPNPYTELPTLPYYEGNVSEVPVDFYDDITLRRRIPSVVYTGSVLQVGGRTERGKKAVTIFLQEKETGQQLQYTGKVSGENFSVPVVFGVPGSWKMGIVFDGGTRSRVAPIAVVNAPRERRFPTQYTPGDAVSPVLTLLPEESQVRLSWQSRGTVLTKMAFTQTSPKRVYRQLTIESGLSSLDIPYDFFHIFAVGEELTLDLWQAESTDGTLREQSSAWGMANSQRYTLVRGFRDEDKRSRIAVAGYARYAQPGESLTLTGEFLHNDGAEVAYVTTPDGLVHPVALAYDDAGQFTLHQALSDEGLYILELVSDAGEILYNRGVYVSTSSVLPVAPWRYSPYEETTASVSGILHWTNTLRRSYGLQEVESDPALSEVAYRYAEQMAREHFISHTSPEGLNFQDRIARANLPGNHRYGENISVATTLQLALGGLETSGSHRQTLLSRQWSRLGVGLYTAGNGDVYVVQVFAD